MGSLTGKVAIVTGGTRGIGRALVTALCGHGAHCVFTYRENAVLADSLVQEMSRSFPGSRTLSVQHDVRDLDGAQSLVERVKEEFDRLDILINSAGITRDKTLAMMTRDDWNAVIETDLTGVFNLSRASIMTFLRQQSGCIVNISSLGGIHPPAGQTNYAAAKAGIIGFTRSLAKEVAPFNVRVNAVAPGFIETDMTGGLKEKKRRHLESRIPLGRFGTADDVARAVLFLVHDESGYITGETIQVDGGLGLAG